MLQLATCTYQEFTPAMGVPIRTTVGYPRFKLGYELGGHARTITPTRPMLKLAKDDYEKAYRVHLDATGLQAIRAELDAFAMVHGQALVLLCFERLNEDGNWCHRTIFAQYWKEHTGQQVPELGATAPPALFPL